MSRSLRQSMLFFLAALVALALVACRITPQAQAPSPNPELLESPLPSPATTPGTALRAFPAELPPLPYDYAALEPYIDAATMRLHHDNHHATYVNNLNDALQQYPDLQNRSVEALLRELETLPEAIRTTVRNNGGGHLNHTLFWQSMAPNAGGAPTDALAEAINQAFGSFDAFKQQFNQAGSARFGSGWVWLVRNPQGELQIGSTANQDNPIMEGLYPIMGNDLWEHAYYLKYQNRRAEYLENWWNVVNWTEIERRLAEAGTA